MSEPANLEQQAVGVSVATPGSGTAVDGQAASTSHQTSAAPGDSPDAAQSDLSAYGSQLFVAETKIVHMEQVAEHLVPAVAVSGDVPQMAKAAAAESATANPAPDRASLDAALPQAKPLSPYPDVLPIRTPHQLKAIEKDPPVTASGAPAPQKAPPAVSAEIAGGANGRAAWLVSCGGDEIPRGTVMPFYFGPGQKPLYSIGIDLSCDIVLKSQGISREHAIFGFDPVTTQFFITDRESTNGTFIHRAEQKIEQVKGQVYLSDGCRIRLGRHPLDFIFRCF